MSEIDINEAKTRKQFIDKALEKAGWGPVVPFHENSRYAHGSVEEYRETGHKEGYKFAFDPISKLN